MIDIALWTAALFLSVLPRRLWDRLEPPFPLRSAAFLSSLAISSIGFAIDVTGTLTFVFESSASRTSVMLGSTLNEAQLAQALANGGTALTLLSFLYFPFFTRLGLFATYLMIAGAIRASSAWFDDPRGDFVLSAVYNVAAAVMRKNRHERRQLAREQLEGGDVPDVLRTGEWAGLTGVDYVVLASRRKPEWETGAIILTSGDWFRLGHPFDLQTPAGLRSAYPLTKLDTVEVVRRGIEYTLPRLSDRATGRPRT